MLNDARESVIHIHSALKNALSNLKGFNLNYAVCFFGGLIFLAIFYLAYGYIDNNLYTVRDDGVITMSHAKNFVDFGFIGVSPSGERVEGFSAPLQFLIYSVVYLLFKIEYSTFATVQTYFCTFLLGVIISAFFIKRVFFALFLTTLCATLLSFQSSFIEWHGSGMENSITHVTFLATILVLFTFSKRQTISLSFVIVPILASLARIESIFHIFPLVFVFAIYWRAFEKSYRGFGFLAIFVFAWSLFQVARFVYFGDFLPNTAYGQSISVGDRISSLFTLDKGFLEQATHTAKYNFSRHGGYLLLLAVPILPFLKWSKANGLLIYLFSVGVLTAWFHPYFFGSARLDATRTVTQLAIYVPGVLAAALFMLRPTKLLCLTPIVLPIAAIIFKLNHIAPYGLCCGIDDFNRFRKEFDEAAASHQIQRPTVSNPDLGAMSWYKQFNIVDLGRLGSKIMAKLRGGPLLSEYYYEFSAPDLIETHEWWSCIHIDSIFSDVRFKQKYKPIRNRWAIGRGACNGKRLPVGIWIRKDVHSQSHSEERQFLEQLQQDISVEFVESSLQNCLSQETGIQHDLSRCTYISRSVFRLLPEFKEHSNFDQLEAIFSRSPSKPFDDFLVTGYRKPHTDEAALAFLLDHFISKYSLKKAKTNGPFQVYLSENFVVYKKENCKKPDIEAPFFLHAINNSAPGFTGLDFEFLDKGFIAGDICGAARALPTTGVSSIKTGQWIPEKRKEVWESRIQLPSK